MKSNSRLARVSGMNSFSFSPTAHDFSEELNEVLLAYQETSSDVLFPFEETHSLMNYGKSKRRVAKKMDE